MRHLFPDEHAAIEGALIRAQVAPLVVIRQALNACRLHARRARADEVRGARSGLAYLALRRRAAAIALGDHIYVREALFDLDQRLPLWLVAHEVTHVVQYRRDGVTRFFFRYVRDYLRGRWQGLGDMAAYRAIPYEEEARRVGDLLM